MKYPSDEDTYRAKIEELKKFAFVPNFFENLEEDPVSGETIVDRVSPGYWNAKLIYSYATDLTCPNADFFRKELAIWIPSSFKYHRNVLTLDKNFKLVLKAGSRWEDILEKAKPVPQTDDPAAQKILDAIYQKTNVSHGEYVKHWVEWHKNQIISVNETIDWFARNQNQNFKNDYIKIVERLQKINNGTEENDFHFWDD